MTPVRHAAPVLFAVLLSACAATAPVAEAPPASEPSSQLPDSAEDSCGASDLAGFIGGDASRLDAVRFANPVRIIRPGDAVTLDFNPERLNFELDVRDRIVRVRCG